MPTDFEELTPDQVLCLALPKEQLDTITSMTTDQALAMGLIPATGKSRVQELREAQEAEQLRLQRRDRRERRRKRRRDNGKE